MWRLFEGGRVIINPGGGGKRGGGQCKQVIVIMTRNIVGRYNNYYIVISVCINIQDAFWRASKLF